MAGLEVPDYVEGAPSESGTEGGEDDLVAFLELVFVFVDAKGN